MTTLQQDIAELSQSKEDLTFLVSAMSKQSSLTNTKSAQVFIFDLRDYAEALDVITEFAPAKPQNKYNLKQLNMILTEQNELLVRILKSLKTAQAEVLKLPEGQLRRTISSLEELKMLNNLILQDNLNFQYFVENEWEPETKVKSVGIKTQTKHYFKNLWDQFKLKK